MPDNLYLKFGKRLVDLLVSLPGLVFISPLLLLICIFIKLTDRGPILFSHTRVGKNFKLFKIYKFRTMVINAEDLGPGVTGQRDARITGIGKWLRRFKLDELPQLLNVIKGNMSLVGPRPEMEKFVRLFQDDYTAILRIKPGITDYAALQYRHEEVILNKYENIEQGYIQEVLPLKIRLYKEYMKELSLSTDLKILFRTMGSMVQ